MQIDNLIVNVNMRKIMRILSKCFHLLSAKPFKKAKPSLPLLIILILVYWIYFIINLSTPVVDVLIEPSKATHRRKHFFIIIVISDVRNVKLRSAHRRVMPKALLDSMNVTRIFLLAKIHPYYEKYISQNVIEYESRAHGDILQGTFYDHYRYLTVKTLMGLQWAAIHYKEASYILKVDDDTIFNLEGTVKLLSSLETKGDFFMGYMLNNTEPVRDNRTKWYMSWEEYPMDVYPPYLSGGYYITTPNTAQRIITEAINQPYVFLESLFITGIICKELNIKLVQLPRGFWLHYYEVLKCCIDDMISRKIMCDAVVGLPPMTGGADNLIVEFNDAIRSCTNCSVRTKEQAFDKVCEPYIRVKNTLGEDLY